MLSDKRRLSIITIAVLGVVSVGIGLSTHGCGVTPPRKTTMAVGATITLMPEAIKSVTDPSLSQNYRNVRVVVRQADKVLSPADKAEVWIYESAEATAPLYKFSMVELVDAYKSTGCSSKLVTHLNTPIKGDGLFCNGALKLSRMHLFILKTPDHADRAVTSIIHEYDDAGDEVASILIPFG